MNFDPRGKPNIIELSSATHPSIIKYGTYDEKKSEYVMTVRLKKYGDLEELTGELLKLAVPNVDKSKVIPMSRVMKLYDEVNSIIDFFDKSPKQNEIFTSKEECKLFFSR